MKRRIVVAFMIILLISNFSLLPVSAESNQQRVFDYAELLSKDEVASLEKFAKKHSEKSGIDYLVVTTPDSDGRDIEPYIADFFDQEYDKKLEHKPAILVAIDMLNRDVVVLAFNDAQKRFDRERASKVREQITPDLSNEDYHGAFSEFIATSAKYYKYKSGVNPDNIFLKTYFQILLALVIGLIVVLILARQERARDTTTAQTYLDDGRSRVLRQTDRYLRTTVTKVKRPKNDSGGSGGGVGGSTSGGSSYSGSRGKF